MNIYKPYTYLIGWSKYNKWYYGVKFAKNCNPQDFWKKYFTSSKKVKQFRKKYGEPDIIQIRKTFKEANSARLWEHKVLRRLKVLCNEKWLNESDSISIPSQKGVNKSETHKQKISISNIGKHSTEHALYASECARIKNTGRKRPEHGILIKELWENGVYKLLKGESHPAYGKPKTEEHKKNLSKSTKYRQKACCIKCHKPNDNYIHEGIWLCHLANHHRNC